MKRLFFLFAFFPSLGWAQVNTSSPDGLIWSSNSGGGSGAIIAGVTLASGCTANWLLYTDSTDHVNCSANMTYDGSVVTFMTANTFRAAVASDGTTNFFKIVGSYPASPSAAVVAASMQFTGAGSASFNEYGLLVSMLPGYTGSSSSYGILGQNSMNGSTGTNIGIGGYGQNNSGSGIAVGLLGYSPFNTGGGAAVGTAGYGGRSDVQPSIGGLFYLSNAFSTDPSALTTLTSSVLMLDTAGSSTKVVPLITGRDGGTQTYILNQKGGEWASTSKTLTETTATAFARFTLVSGSSFGGNIDYCIEANDATDFQSRCGMLPVAAVDKAGTITCTVGTVTTATEVVSISSGTLTNTFTCADSGTNFLDIKANATSSLTQTVLRINYFARQQGNTQVVFTPQ